MSPADKSQLGFSEEGRAAADEVKAAYPFRELMDVYRLGIAIALAEELDPASDTVARRTYINVGSLDPDGRLRASIEELRDDHDGRPYALAERLAESGILKLLEHARAGRPLRDYLEKVTSD